MEVNHILERKITDNIAVQHKKWLIILLQNISCKSKWSRWNIQQNILLLNKYKFLTHSSSWKSDHGLESKISMIYWSRLTFQHYTVRCHYNTVNFLKNINKSHPIARLLGRGMGYLLRISIGLIFCLSFRNYQFNISLYCTAL